MALTSRTALVTVAKLVAGLVPLVWLLAATGVERVLGHLGSVGVGHALPALGAALLAPVLGSVRWRVLMLAYGASAPPGIATLTRHYLVGAYYGILPTGLAGDIVRGYRVREFLSTAATYTVVFLERVYAMVGLLVLATAALVAVPQVAASAALTAVSWAVVLALAAALTLVALPHAMLRRPTLATALHRVPLAGKVLRRLPPARRPGLQLLALALSTGIQVLPIVTTYVLSAAVAPEVTLGMCARVVPLVVLLTAIPVTPVGLGQRELLFVYFFGLLGVPADRAMAVSLLVFALLLCVCLLGGLIHLVERLAGVSDRSSVR